MFSNTPIKVGITWVQDTKSLTMKVSLSSHSLDLNPDLLSLGLQLYR